MDISIYDNYSGASRDFDFFPIDGEYKTCDSMLTIICLKGEATFRLRLHDFKLTRCHSLIIGPEIPFFIVSSSPDFHIDVVRVGESIFDVGNYDDVIRKRLRRLIIDRPLNKLTERKTRMFHIIHSYLKILLKERSDYYRDIIVFEYIKIFLYEACHILDDTSSEGQLSKKDRKITNNFFHLLERNFMEHRKVDFYAEELEITPKHLAHVLRKTTGKTPSEWLDNYTLLESKKLLRTSDESMQSISYDLNFATPSHFSRFFKAKTGMTPKEFRNQINEE